MFNAEKVKNECVAWIRNFFEENGKGCNAVVGLCETVALFALVFSMVALG